MGFPVFLAGVVAVVGGHQRQSQLVGQPDVDLPGGVLLGNVVTLKLQVKAILKDLGQFQGSRFGSLVIPSNGVLLHLALQTA